MKYAMSFALFIIAAACVATIVMTPYNPGTAEVLTKTTTEIVYQGGNFSTFSLLGFLAVAAGLGGFIAAYWAIDADKQVKQTEIDALRRMEEAKAYQNRGQ